MQVAFLIKGRTISAWQTALIKEVNQIAGFTVFLWIAKMNESNSDQRISEKSSLSPMLKQFLTRRKTGWDAFKPTDPEKILGIHPSIVHINSAPDQQLEIDLLLNLISTVDERKLSRFFDVPVWGIRFGSRWADISDPLATAHEVLNSIPVTELQIIQATPPTHQASTFHQSASSTKKFSSCANAGQLAWKAVECIPRLLRTWKASTLPQNAPSTALLAGNLYQSVEDDGRKQARESLQNMPLWLGSRLFRKAKKAFIRDQWILMVGRSSENSYLPGDLKPILPPKDRIWADPFFLRRNGKLYVFFEELLFRSGRGRIACGSLAEDGTLSEVVPVVEREYHLSYPFLLEVANDLFMIPESAENRTVELYRCRSFPDQWEFVDNLMSGVKAWDTTLFFHNGYWWLFCNMTPVDGMSDWDQLYLFYAQEFPTKNWTPHPGNPIVDDVRSSRPAGNLFVHNSKIIRPSQDSAGRYGRGLNFNEVIELTIESYREQEVEKVLGPSLSAGMKGLHTYNRCGDRFIVDAEIARLTF